MSKLNELIQQLCPDGVEWKTLNDIGEFFGGLTGKSKNDFIDGNAAFITYSNIYSNPSLNLNIDEKVRIDDGEKQNVIQYGDILFTGSSETPEECGMSSVVTKEPTEKMYLNSFCFGLRLFKLDKFNFDYLKHLFRSAEIRKEICKTANGVTRFNVSKKKMGEIAIPLPPLPVQEEIVRLLDALTETTQKYQAELEAELDARKKQYEEYRKKILTFEESRIDVKWYHLGDIGNACMCRRIMKNQTTTEGEIPFYKIGTFGKVADAYISRELYDLYKKNYSFPRKGDILLSASGTIGRTVVYNGEDAYYQDSNIVWVDNNEQIILNSYLFYVYKIIDWKTANGGVIERLYNNILLSAQIQIPPLAEQERIVNILDRMDKTHKELCKSIEDEIKMRKQQYEYYRNQLLDFNKKED